MESRHDEKKPHVMCIPYPAQGHVNSMMKLAMHLHSKGIHITFVHSEFNYARILLSNNLSAFSHLPGFNFEAIPDGQLSASDKTGGQHLESLSSSVAKASADPLRDLLRRLNHASSVVPPVTLMVSDICMSFTLDVAAEFQIKNVSFVPISACSYMGILHSRQLVEKGLTPLKSEDDLSNGYLETTIDWIPGMKNIKLKDLPSMIRTTDPNDILFNFSMQVAERSLEASAVIINTFNDLEGPVLDGLYSLLPPIYAVGPLSLISNAASTMSFWKEDDDSCMKWLDERNPNSVVYVNFGSLATLTEKQRTEFAWGLADSGHDFLWVMRPSLVNGEEDALPEAYVDEIKGRGLILSWCTQERVLAHPSIGGFLTHCGWNSVMESVSNGIPMLCWPYIGDQQTNCHYVCDEWGIGMEIDSEVKRDQVEVMVRELIGGIKGGEMKKKAMDWKELAIAATQMGGKSFMDLEKFSEKVCLGS